MIQQPTRVSPLAIPTNGEGRTSTYHLNRTQIAWPSDEDFHLRDRGRPEPRGRRYAGYDEEEGQD